MVIAIALPDAWQSSILALYSCQVISYLARENYFTTEYPHVWLVGWCLTTVPVTKTIRLSEWVTPGDTAIPGMTSLKDGDLQHSSALVQSPERRYRTPTIQSEINPKPDSQ